MKRLSRKEYLFVGESGRKFIVNFSQKGEIFIGTEALFSHGAAQLVCQDVMKPLKWELSGNYRDLFINGHLCIATGYKVPPYTNAKKTLCKLFA